MSPKRCQNPQHWPWHMWKCLCVPNLYVAPGAAVMSCAGLSDWGWTRGLFWRWLRCLPSWPERRIDMCGKDSRWSVTNPRNFQVLLAVGWACFWHAQFLRPPLQRCKNAAQKRDCPKHSCKGCGEERLQRQLKGNMTPKQVNHLAGIKTCSQLLRNFSHALRMVMMIRVKWSSMWMEAAHLHVNYSLAKSNIRRQAMFLKIVPWTVSAFFSGEIETDHDQSSETNAATLIIPKNQSDGFRH